MENLRKHINSIYPISDENFEIIFSHSKILNLKKGDILIRQGEVSPYLFLIDEGSVKSYYIKDEKEKAYWFAFEGEIACSPNNFILNKPSIETIETLEDCKIFKIFYPPLKEMYKDNIDIVNLGRRIVELGIMHIEEELLMNQIPSAKARYNYLLENHPHIIKRVQLGYIASFLGISQVTLSRLRTEI